MDNENTEGQPEEGSAVNEAYAEMGKGSDIGQELLAGKFESPEKLEEAYLNLQKKMGEQSGEPQPQEGGVDETQATPEETPSEETPQEIVEEAGVNWEELKVEFNETGEVSEGKRKALNDIGIDDDTINDYRDGQLALAREFNGKVADEVGGDDTYDAMIKWAETNWSEAQIEAYDKAVTSRNFEVAALAAKGLAQAYREINGQEPNLIGGGKASDTGAAFKSTDEMIKAMNDPRYGTDAAYRSEVDQKVARMASGRI